ncbi:MAG: hypothetical protein VX836_18365 [Pseudomonadota bacterium]|nr:hypothetical protein [Pseudomonadota bacterium]
MAGKKRRTFLSIVGWERMQPKHGDRTFPWIRLHDACLDDPNIRKLPKEIRADYFDMLLLANRCSNMVPESPETIAFWLRTDEALDIEALVSAGLVCRRRAGKKAANNRQGDGLEVEVEVEVEEKKEEKVEVEGGLDDLSRSERELGSSSRDEWGVPDPPSADDLLIFLSDDQQPYQVTAVDLSAFEMAFGWQSIDVAGEVRKFADRMRAKPMRDRPKRQYVRADLEAWIKGALKKKDPMTSTSRTGNSGDGIPVEDLGRSYNRGPW